MIERPRLPVFLILYEYLFFCKEITKIVVDTHTLLVYILNMPKRSSKKKMDTNQLAAYITDEATGELLNKATQEGKNPAAVLLGRLGGLKGGKARAAKLTPEQRSNIAKKAARIRWKKQ